MNNGVSLVVLSLILAVVAMQLYFSYATYQISKDGHAEQQVFSKNMENSIKEFAMLTVLQDDDAKDLNDKKTLQYEALKGDFLYFKPIVINIDSQSGKRHFLRLKITLNVAEGAADEVIGNIPVILDRVHAGLRMKTLSDFRGREGTDVIRETIKAAVESRLGPDKVKEILFQEMLVQ